MGYKIFIKIHGAWAIATETFYHKNFITEIEQRREAKRLAKYYKDTYGLQTKIQKVK